MNLQRVKNPPIRLSDFASVDSMREEINEVVAFLQNPSAFQEMGARAPRVCYIKDIMYFCILYLTLYLLFFFCKKWLSGYIKLLVSSKKDKKFFHEVQNSPFIL